MRPRPDLSLPALPDPEDLDAPIRSTGRRTLQGGMNLRQDSFEWPESGPSESSKVKGVGRTSDGPSVSAFQAKAIAAMTGAATTSLLMTPFDVLKTRLQTVKPHPRPDPRSFVPSTPSSECCQTSILTPPRTRFPSSSANNTLTCFSSGSAPSSTLTVSQAELSFASLRGSTSAIPPPSGCLHPSKWAGIWGETVTMEQALTRAGSGGTATLVLPGEGHGALGGFWSEIAAVRRETGIKGLWKGVGTTLTMSIPSSAIYMLGYEKLLTIISPYFTGSDDPSANVSSLNRSPNDRSITASLTPAPLVAGALARTISATTISPIEMFRTRLQALPNEHGAPTYSSVAKEMSRLIKTKGITVLWRGLGPTLWRDVPFSGIYWAGFEVIKSKLSADTDLTPIAASFVSGAISGTFSALVTQPFDVLKTRRQVFTPSPDCSLAALQHRASTLPLALHVVRTEGWGALFAGTVPRCGKVAPACGLMIACYEGVGRYLGGSKHEEDKAA